MACGRSESQQCFGPGIGRAPDRYMMKRLYRSQRDELLSALKKRPLSADICTAGLAVLAADSAQRMSHRPSAYS